jgi:hypothetical protein
MSLNSLQDDMSRRAASMAAMAKGARNPEQIQAIQKSLIAGVQSGAIKPYVGIPLIQELTNKLSEVKAKMAQSVAGAGMQQPQQGGAPIAEQVMAQAAQADRSQGVEALQSNLPESYAGGGIIAFEDGGQVERYQSAGYTGATPAGRFFSGLGQNFTEANEMAKLRNKLQMQYGPASAVPGLFMRQTDEERLAAKAVASALPNLSFPQLQQLAAEGPSALAGFSNPAATGPIIPYGQSQATNLLGGNTAAPDPAAPAAPSAAPGGGGFKMPTMQTYTPTIATLPERKMGNLTDLDAITKDMDKKTKTAFGDAVKASQAELESFDKPGFESREGRLGEREAGIEKESAISRALTGIKTGLRIAGSKERTLAGALGNEGSQGIEELIKGEAAKRAAKDRLEDMRDNLEQQKVAAKKGNYQAAQTAGREASRDLQAATQLSLTGAQAGNAQSINMYNALSQSDIGKAGVLNQGEQLKLSAVDSANRSAQGIAGLGLQAQQLAQTGAFQNKQLAAMEQRYAALGKQAQARMAQVRAGAIAKFNETQGGQLNAQLTSEYGKNWRTAQDPRSLQAQTLFKQAQNAYIMDALGQYDVSSSARSAEGLLGLGE